MKMGKWLWWHILLVGVLVTILVGGVFYGVLIRPKQQQVATLKKQYEADWAVGSPEAQQRAQADLDRAKADVALMKTKWAKYSRRMPSVDMQDPYKGMAQLWREYNKVLGPLMERFVATLPLEVSGQIQIPGAPVDPAQIPRTVTLSLGTWQGTGKLSQILAMFPAWSKAPRVVVIEGMTLQAVQPNVTDDLTVSFNPTIYMLIENAGGAGAPGTAGGMGGMPGGGGGMPGMMGGGGAPGGMMGGGGMPGGGMMKGPGMMPGGGGGMPGGGQPGGGMMKGPGMMPGGGGMPGAMKGGGA